MTLVPAKCPKCSASIQVPNEIETASCMYCGSSISVRDALSSMPTTGPDAKRLFELGEASLESSRSEEAHNYFTRAIESDATFADPWFGKARSAFNLASLADNRKDEIIFCCKQYIALNNSSRDSVNKVINLLTQAGSWLSSRSFTVFQEYGGTFVGQLGSMMSVTDEQSTHEWLMRTHDSYMLHMEAMTYAVMEETGIEESLVGMLDSLERFAKNCIFVSEIMCSVNLTDGSSRSSKSRNVLVRGMNEELRNGLLSDYENRRLHLVKIAPTMGAKYTALETLLNKANETDSKYSGPCFIATACYGSKYDNDVVLLRKFRDRILKKHGLGRAFIKHYYRHGSSYANLIRESRALKKMTRFLICHPLVIFAAIVLSIKTKSNRTTG